MSRSMIYDPDYPLQSLTDSSSKIVDRNTLERFKCFSFFSETYKRGINFKCMLFNVKSII